VSVLIPTAPVKAPRSAATGVLACTAVIALLYFGRLFFITLIIAVILAFLLDPAVRLFMKLKLPRGLASFVVCSLALIIVYLAGLGLYAEFGALLEDLPAYSQRISQLIDQVGAKVDELERDTVEMIIPKRYRETPPAASEPVVNTRSRRGHPAPAVPAGPPPIQEVRIHQEPRSFLTYLFTYVSSFYGALLMASFVPFLVYFMLAWRDHLRLSFLHLFPPSARAVAGRSWEAVAEIARAYVLGNFLLGILLSIVSSAFFVGVRLPYALLIGPLSGFLSLVPYVGVPLAVIPPLVAALAVYSHPGMFIVIALAVALFHLLALNLLFPKMVGSRVHLNPLVVTVALMFWGTLWGGIGLLLAIPITAAIKSICDNVTALNGYGKLLGDV
jgi:predicted PurR-regulated permease PerM